MLRVDLKAAGIPYRDSASLLYDFHALRCQMSTLLDASGVSPRTVQRLMRHSSPALTDRCTRLRVVDLESTVRTLPDLGTPARRTPGTLTATGMGDVHTKDVFGAFCSTKGTLRDGN